MAVQEVSSSLPVVVRVQLKLRLVPVVAHGNSRNGSSCPSEVYVMDLCVTESSNPEAWHALKKNVTETGNRKQEMKRPVHPSVRGIFPVKSSPSKTFYFVSGCIS